jgi:Kef-type K+ transport system membrane component KefB
VNSCLANIVPVLGIASVGREASGDDVVTAIQISIIAASILAISLHRLRQPSLVAFILAGLLLGAVIRPILGDSIQGTERISHLGLVLLVFVIGLELDLRKVLGLGKAPAAAILLQSPIAIAVVWGLQALLRSMDVHVPGLAGRPEGELIFAAAAALSSTAVVVRLLADRFDLTSQAGRVTVLTLIAQDICAVTVISYLSTQGSDRGAWAIVPSMFGGAVVTVAMAWTARRLLTHVMRFMAAAPDLIALSALAWCFIGSAAFRMAGLSAEMGALVAGLTIGSLPQASEVLSKVSNLRDFFMALFFVALGMSLPPPSVSAILGACMLTGIVILARFVLFAPTLLAARLGGIVSLAATINLAQLSEFSLLFLPVGMARGAITQEEASVISYALMLSVMLSSFAIRYNYSLARRIAGWLGMGTGLSGREPADRPGTGAGHAPADIYLLGCHLHAEALLRRIRQCRPDLLGRILIIDYNLIHHERLRGQGVRVVYGDISNPEMLRHAGIERAKVVVSTIPDAFLRGTTNEQLIDLVRSMAPGARVITTSVREEEVAEQTARGAFSSICEPAQAAQAYLDAIDQAIGASQAGGCMRPGRRDV